MTWIVKNKVLKHSGCYNVNFLFNNGKFYVMDNHLAASWCWSQKIDPSKRYGLFHIDRHYDLLPNLSDTFISNNRDILIGDDFNAYISLKNSDNLQAVRFDNYIDLFNRLYPNLINRVYYLTHKDGLGREKTSLEHIESSEPNLWDLPSNLKYWITECHKDVDGWIVNIDLDFFFIGEGNDYFQFFTKKYIRNICKEIKDSLSQIDVITIAISPEFCNGWGDAFNILKTIITELDIFMPYQYKKCKEQSLLF